MVERPRQHDHAPPAPASGAAGRRGRRIWSAAVEPLGYRLVPFDAAALAAADDRTGRALLRALAVAGFAAGNVMLLSVGDLGRRWRRAWGRRRATLLHWVSALIAMPAIAYAGTAVLPLGLARAARSGRTNMDVPISIGVAAGHRHEPGRDHARRRRTPISTRRVTLLFFLLIGRVLDHRARGQARATARAIARRCAPPMSPCCSPTAACRAARRKRWRRASTCWSAWASASASTAWSSAAAPPLDASLVTGESLPVAGRARHAGVRRHAQPGAPLSLRASPRPAEATLLAECVRLIEAAETRRGRFVVLADRVARRYAPVVHLRRAADLPVVVVGAWRAGWRRRC